MKKLFTILAFAVCINTNAQVCFKSTNYWVGYGNTTIACADFNSDGNLDLVVTMYGDQDIYMLLGDGHGGFDSAIVAYTDSSMFPDLRCFISGDFNRDGNADLAVAEWGSPGFVKVLFGDGTGHFPTSNNFAVGQTPFSICSGDFNGDGKLDIATANSDSHNVSVLLGDGTGNFSTHTDFHVGSGPVSITTGDFNGDGKLDIAVANDNGGGADSVWVLLGDGTGNFGTASKYLAGSGPYSVCSGDFNGDGFDDIAVANNNSSNVSVLLSQGASGVLNSAINYATGGESFSVVSGDFNGDGKPDLAVANFTAATKAICILQNTGTGSFKPAVIFRPGSRSTATTG